MFNLYLDVAKSLYDSERPFDKLKRCIQSCEYAQWKLFGMLDLMVAIGEVDYEKSEVEKERIIETFNSVNICNAYMTEGEVMVFSQR